jgi:hypothetical protein
MINEINKQEFEKLSFWQLLKKCSVEIPIIQRNYAQGRPVRNGFLNVLKEDLTNNNVERDFVYGNAKYMTKI